MEIKLLTLQAVSRKAKEMWNLVKLGVGIDCRMYSTPLETKRGRLKKELTLDNKNRRVGGERYQNRKKKSGSNAKGGNGLAINGTNERNKTSLSLSRGRLYPFNSIHD